MRIITAANERYFGHITPYLDTIAKYSQVPATLVCVGDKVLRHPGVSSVQLPRTMNIGAPPETESPQHGAWLQVVPGNPDDVCIFTDGDITLQRPFTDEELDDLADVGDRVFCGINSKIGETLADEAARLFPRVPIDRLARVFGPIHDIFSFNIGVIVAKRSTFQAIYTEYMSWWDIVTEALGHAARQQWLVNWVIDQLDIPISVTPYSFHANGHYGVPPGCRYDNGLLYHRQNLVLFRHKL